MYPVSSPHGGGKDLLLLAYIDVYKFTVLPVALIAMIIETTAAEATTMNIFSEYISITKICTNKIAMRLVGYTSRSFCNSVPLNFDI
jgi:hypothetical protein